MKHDNKTIDPEGFLLVNDDWSPSNFTGKVKHEEQYTSGSYKAWYKNNKLHREDGPAVIRHDGSKYWYKHGLRHREDGPAVESSSGNKYWYKNGWYHREDGPAVEKTDGHTEWWYNGNEGLENFPPELKKKLARKFIIQ